MLQPGTRVYVKSLQATGIIAYARMAPPSYSTPEVYSVKLDHLVWSPAFEKHYNGTIVKADDVETMPVHCIQCQKETGVAIPKNCPHV